ncbi:hypothetical protein [Chromobacterium sp. CV08]|uniref:hypothetical protein n=1 Tax=Chromobacterium sp. CV08 TaxID=3133274 RepID=UPI003DA8D178
MEHSYATLIDQERAKIALLKTKIVECERRIAVLQSLANADDLDNVLSKTVAHEVRPQVVPQPSENVAVPITPPSAQYSSQNSSNQSFEMPKKKLSTSVISLLNFIGVEGKSLDELENFSNEEQLGVDRGAIRSFASAYRRKFGFLHSPRLGFVQLTQRGLAYMETHGHLLNGETPSVGAESVSGTSIQAAVTGSNESDDLI